MYDNININFEEMVEFNLFFRAFSLNKNSSTNTHIDTQQKLKVKIKCTFVQALRLCTGRTAHRGSRGIALL
jgi:hypothetical protein